MLIPRKGSTLRSGLHRESTGPHRDPPWPFVVLVGARVGSVAATHLLSSEKRIDTSNLKVKSDLLVSSLYFDKTRGPVEDYTYSSLASTVKLRRRFAYEQK